MLRLAQRQYSLLQAANLLTPDMISEFETLQQLVLKESIEHGPENPRSPGLARGDPLAQELCSESSECHLLVHPLRSSCSEGGRLEPNRGHGSLCTNRPKRTEGLRLFVHLLCPIFYIPSFSLASPSLDPAFSFSLSRVFRVLWSSNPDHGKATEWSHTHTGDPTGT